MDDLKVCNRCKQPKPRSEFYTDKSRPDGLLYRCKPCHKAYVGAPEALARRRAAARRQGARRKAYGWEIKTRYGITFEEWHALLVAQAGRCAACGDQFTNKRGAIHVDHCHDTGWVRGLLCSACNTSEGLLQGDPTRILRLLEYVCAQPGKEDAQCVLTRWLAQSKT